MSMQQLYQQLILDHAKERHGYGLTGNLADPGTGESFQVNPTCGDEVRLRVRVSDGVVASLTWEGTGCSISQASTSVLTDLTDGAELAHVRELHEQFGTMMHSRGAELGDAAAVALADAAAFAGVSRYPARVKCALLGWMALQDALTKAGATGAAPGKDA